MPRATLAQNANDITTHARTHRQNHLPRGAAPEPCATLAPAQDSVFEAAMPLRTDLGARLDEQAELDTALALPVNSDTTSELRVPGDA